MNILGLGCFFHDSAAAIIKDGKLIASVEEERLNRIKHSNDFPEKSISYCLEKANLSPSDIDHVAYYADYKLALRYRVPNILLNLPRSLSWRRTHAKGFFSILNLKKLLKVKLGSKAKFKLHYVEHHIAHAASSFLVSPFERAAILSADGMGEWATTMLAVGEGNKIRPIKRVYFPNSLGKVYTAVSVYLGFNPLTGPGKVMGLASYGEPKYLDCFKKIVKKGKKGDYFVDTSFFPYHLGRDNRFSEKFIEMFGPPRSPEAEIEKRHMDVAASLQKLLEEIMLYLADELYEATGEKNLCLAGGIALNSVANGLILENSPFKDVYIQPAASDGGAALGAAFYVYNHVLNNERKYIMQDAYIGTEFSDGEYAKSIKKFNLPFEKDENIEKKAAELISNGKIIGWFQGKMEFGPRALGARSILADARNPKMKDLLNERVKHREGFRPFAPSVLEDYAGDYFETNHPSPFMLLVRKVKNEKRSRIPSVTHVDNTGRLQTVSRKTNPKYYKLIDEFHKITGVPVVLNTSFNVRGEPIVSSPEDAIKCFLNTNIDYLVLGNYLIKKDKVNQ